MWFQRYLAGAIDIGLLKTKWWFGLNHSAYRNLLVGNWHWERLGGEVQKSLGAPNGQVETKKSFERADIFSKYYQVCAPNHGLE